MKLLVLATLLFPAYCSAAPRGQAHPSEPAERDEPLYGSGPAAPIPTLFTKAPRPGALTRFARLAGMFMGRVDVARVGGTRMKLKLEIR